MVTFTHRGAERIKRAVGRILDAPRDMTGERARTTPQETEVWGLIVGTDITGLRFAWVKVAPAATNDESDFVLRNGLAFALAADGDVVGFSAREANGNKGVPTYYLARLNFIGYDAAGLPAYLFHYHDPWQDQPLRPHDHRDNTYAAGGLAFSVYHPGTSLPQQNFPV